MSCERLAFFIRIAKYNPAGPPPMMMIFMRDQSHEKAQEAQNSSELSCAFCAFFAAILSTTVPRSPASESQTSLHKFAAHVRRDRAFRQLRPGPSRRRREFERLDR